MSRKPSSSDAPDAGRYVVGVVALILTSALAVSNTGFARCDEAAAQAKPETPPAASAPALAPAPAPSPPAPALADTSRPAMFLKETVVTGARYPRTYYESPQALSFVSRLQLREQASTVLGDVLGTMPGTDNSKDSPWEQRPVLRGLGGQRVLVLVDGMPMNSARGNGPHPSLVDPAQVERIEVVRGPSSVAYGSDALGGVINIITREAVFTAPGQNFRGSATVGGSTADAQRNAYLEVMPRLGRLSAFVSSAVRKAENFDSPSGEVPNSSFDDYSALANLRYDLTEKTALKLGWQLYRGRDIGIPGLSFDSPGAKQNFEFDFYDRDFAHLTLDHGYRNSWLAGTRVKLYWQQERRNFFSDQTVSSSLYDSLGIPPRGGSTEAQTLVNRFFDLNTFGFQTQLTTVKAPRWFFTAGLDALRDQTDGDTEQFRTYYDASGNPVPSATGVVTRRTVSASVPDGRFDNYGGYLQSEWYLHPRWTLSAGSRYTHYRYRTDYGPNQPAFGQPFESMKVDDDAGSGSVGLVYTPVRDLHLSVNVANGYRQPNAQDLFFSGFASVGYVEGNPTLKAEKSMSYDLGVKWGPGALAMVGNLFYSSYDDLIDAVAVPPLRFLPPGTPTYQYTNISEARIWGGEAEAEWRFLPQWTARGTAAGAIGDITSAEAIQALYGVTADEAPLPNVPPFKGSASVRWTSAQGRYWIEPAMRFSWRTNRLPLPTPGIEEFTQFKKEWMVGDLMTGARLPGGQRLLLGVRNFADTEYQQALGSLEEPGINFVGSLSADF